MPDKEKGEVAPRKVRYIDADQYQAILNEQATPAKTETSSDETPTAAAPKVRYIDPAEFNEIVNTAPAGAKKKATEQGGGTSATGYTNGGNDYARQVYESAIAEGASEDLADLLVAQAKHESGNFNSNVFKKNNNPFGMTYAGQKGARHTNSAITKGHEFAAFDNVAAATKNVVDWLKRRQKEGKLDMSQLKDPDGYAKSLKNSKYFEEELDEYANPLKRHYIKGVGKEFTQTAAEPQAVAVNEPAQEGGATSTSMQGGTQAQPAPVSTTVGQPTDADPLKQFIGYNEMPYVPSARSKPNPIDLEYASGYLKNVIGSGDEVTAARSVQPKTKQAVERIQASSAGAFTAIETQRAEKLAEIERMHKDHTLWDKTGRVYDADLIREVNNEFENKKYNLQRQIDEAKSAVEDNPLNTVYTVDPQKGVLIETPKQKSIRVVKEKTEHATELLSKEAVAINGAVNPVAEAALKPNGDPMFTTQMARLGVAELLKKKQEAMASANQDMMSGGNMTKSQVDEIGKKYDQEIQELQEAANHVVSLQVVGKQLNRQNTITKDEADAQIAEENAKYQKEREGISKLSYLPDQEQPAVDELNKKHQEAIRKIKENVQFDPVMMGLEKRALSSNNVQVQDDLRKYKAGQPLDPARKYEYERDGLQMVQDAANNAYADGDQAAALKLNTLSANMDKTLAKNNPEVTKDIKLARIADYIYQNRNPIYGTVFSMDDISKQQMEEAALKLGMSKEDIADLKPSELPKTAGVLKRIVAEGGGAAVKTFFMLPEDDIASKKLTLNIPQAQQQDEYSVSGIAGKMASTIGTIGAFVGQTEMLGGVLKEGALLGDIAANASRYELAAQSIPLLLSSYNGSLEESKRLFGDSDENESKRQSYAILNAMVSTALMSISPITKVGKSALGISSTEAGRSLIKEIEKGGLENLTRPALESKLKQVLLETSKETGKQMAIFTAIEAAKNITNMMFDPNGGHDLTDNLGKTALDTGISMFLPSLMHGMHKPENQTKLNQNLMYEVGTNPYEYKKALQEKYEKGEMETPEYQSAIKGIERMEYLVNNQLPETKLDGEPLTEAEKSAYAWNLLKSQDLADKYQRAEKTGDKAQIKSVSNAISELEKEREEILYPSGEYAPAFKPKPVYADESSEEVVNEFPKEPKPADAEPVEATETESEKINREWDEELTTAETDEQAAEINAKYEAKLEELKPKEADATTEEPATEANAISVAEKEALIADLDKRWEKELNEANYSTEDVGSEINARYEKEMEELQNIPTFESVNVNELKTNQDGKSNEETSQRPDDRTQAGNTEGRPDIQEETNRSGRGEYQENRPVEDQPTVKSEGEADKTTSPLPVEDFSADLKDLDASKKEEMMQDLIERWDDELNTTRSSEHKEINKRYEAEELELKKRLGLDDGLDNNTNAQGGVDLAAELGEGNKVLQDAMRKTIAKGDISEYELTQAIREANSLRDKAKQLEGRQDFESQVKRYELLDEADRIESEATNKILPFQAIVDSVAEMSEIESKSFNETKCRTLSSEHQKKYGGRYVEVEVENKDGTKVIHAVVVHDNYVYEPQSDSLIRKNVFDEYFNTNIRETKGEKPPASTEGGDSNIGGEAGKEKVEGTPPPPPKPPKQPTGEGEGSGKRKNKVEETPLTDSGLSEYLGLKNTKKNLGEEATQDDLTEAKTRVDLADLQADAKAITQSYREGGGDSSKWGKEMLNDIKAVKNDGKKQAVAAAGLHIELQSDRLRNDARLVELDAAIMSEKDPAIKAELQKERASLYQEQAKVKNLIGDVQNFAKKLKSAASDVMNTGRLDKLMYDEVLTELYEKQILNKAEIAARKEAKDILEKDEPTVTLKRDKKAREPKNKTEKTEQQKKKEAAKKDKAAEMRAEKEEKAKVTKEMKEKAVKEKAAAEADFPRKEDGSPMTPKEFVEYLKEKKKPC